VPTTGVIVSVTAARDGGKREGAVRAKIMAKVRPRRNDGHIWQMKTLEFQKSLRYPGTWIDPKAMSSQWSGHVKQRLKRSPPSAAPRILSETGLT
jgi:hypothetical protein